MTMSRRILTAREQYDLLAPWRTAAAPEDDPIWQLLEPTSEWGGGRSTRNDPPPPLPKPEPKRELPPPIEGVPRGRETDYQKYSQQPDVTSSTHLWMPTEIADHYKEYDHPIDDDQTVTLEKTIREHGGIRQPLTLTANATHGLMTEGNHRIAIAKKLGIPEVPVRFMYHPTQEIYPNNPGHPLSRPPAPHHPAMASWMDKNRHLFPLEQEKHTQDMWRGRRDEGLQGERLSYRTAMEENVVTLYTKPGCPQCDMTKRRLEHHEIPHQVIDVTQDPDAYAHVTQNLGYSSAPVVDAGGGNHWFGFRPDRIKGLLG